MKRKVTYTGEGKTMTPAELRDALANAVRIVRISITMGGQPKSVEVEEVL